MSFQLTACVVLGLATLSAAQSVTAGSTADVASEATALFADANAITNVSASFAAGKVSGVCGGIPEEIQFGVARGFRGANGFILSNAWVENQDMEGLSMGTDPSGCANGEGTVGAVPLGGVCSGTDAMLNTSLTDINGAPVNTEDAAIMTIAFDAPAGTILDLSYNLMTYEAPTDAFFYDTFAIFLDGALMAGGTTNGTPPPGTDPWVLAPSSISPSEYNSLTTNIFFVVPAHETGLRTMELDLGPSAASHTLEFHIADGNSQAVDVSCSASSDNVVDSSLFVGLHTYQTGNPGGTTPTLEIGRLGHPAITGGAFGDDLQITLAGAPPGALLVYTQSLATGPAATLPLLAPNEILIGLMPLALVATQTASGSNVDVFPAVPPTIPPQVAGRSLALQWWAVTPSEIQNSKAMNLRF